MLAALMRYWEDTPPAHIILNAAYPRKKATAPTPSPVAPDRAKAAQVDMSAEDFLAMMPGGRIIGRGKP